MTATTIVNRYLEDCRELFSEPANFFRSQLDRRSLSEALFLGYLAKVSFDLCCTRRGSADLVRYR
jgi:hypothetical protein